MEIKKTSLNKLHQNNNAKFVEFAGYEMPIQYSKGIIEEHKFTRSHSGIFDVSHMGQLFIYGDESLTEELEKIFPLDLKNLKQNSSKYSFLMNEDAGIYDDLIITKIAEGYLIILNAACKDKDFEILSNLLGSKFKMNLDSNRSLIAIQGPKSVEILNSIINGVDQLNFMTGNWFDSDNQKLFVTRSGYTGEDGVEIIFDNNCSKIIWEIMKKLEIPPCGLGARDLLRIEAGLHLYGHEINEYSNPVDIGLKRLLETKSQNYINHEYINDSDIENGNFSIAAFLVLDRGIPREENEVFYENNVIGKITSGTHSPTLKSSIAIGLIKRDFNIVNNKVRIKVRDKFLEAEIRKLPMYRRRRKWMKFLNH